MFFTIGEVSAVAIGLTSVVVFIYIDVGEKQAENKIINNLLSDALS
jgi:hypothetical protein